MADIAQRLDIIHESYFAAPAFELLREFPPILKAFYETLATRFSLNPEHITLTSANALSDLLWHIGLFNNVASVELRTDRMSVRLPNINNKESVAVARDAIILAHEALNKSLPKSVSSKNTFLANMWFAMEGGVEAADNLLQKLSRPATIIDGTSWGAKTSRYSFRQVSRNDEEGWTAVIFGDPSLVPGSHLFLSIELTIFAKGMKSIVDQLALAEIKLNQVLRGIGLNIAEEQLTK